MMYDNDASNVMNDMHDSLLGSIDAEDPETLEGGRIILGKNGLSIDQANKLLEVHGPNKFSIQTRNRYMRMTSVAWAPMSILMYIVIIIEILDGRWADVCLLVIFLFGTFIWVLRDSIETSIASNLMKSNSPDKVWVKRDGRYKSINSIQLVPGDVIRFKTGDIIPADVVLLEGPPVDTDQSELTGECLPIVTYAGDAILMGTIVKFGIGEG